MNCPECGAENEEESITCDSCGASLEEGDAVIETVEVDAAIDDSSQAEEQESENKDSAETEEAGESKGKSKRAIIVAVAAVAVLIIAIIVLFNVFAAKPTYVVSEIAMQAGDVELDYSYELSEEGALLSTSYNTPGFEDSVSYEELAEGITIETGTVGFYEENEDGYICYYEVSNEAGVVLYSKTFEYYSPGIIQTITVQAANETRVYEYDEEGWPISLQSQSAMTSSEVTYTYEKGGDTVTVSADTTQTIFGQDVTSTLSGTLEIDNHGNIVSMQNDIASYAVSYVEVKKPYKMVVALGRLKDVVLYL